MSIRSTCVRTWIANPSLFVSARSVLSWFFVVSFILILLTSRANAAQVTLSWQDPNNNPADVGGYNLYYWQAGQTPSVVNVGDSTTYTLAGLEDGTTYHFTVTAHDGTGGRESIFSNEVTYTITNTPSGCPCSIWDAATTPVAASWPDANAVELGMKFRTEVDGHITGIRFYKGAGNTGTHVGHLWTNSGTLLASVTFTNETATGWQQATLPTPVAITANTTYVVSYYAPVGRYAVDASYFTTAVVNPPLRALASGTSGGNGVYKYGASGFPTQTYNASNYWIDVAFNTITTPEPTPPPVAAFSATPTSGTAPLTVNFTNTSSGAISSHSWTFGDNTSSAATNPSHIYTTPGVYMATLTVTGPGGTDTASTSITVAAVDTDGDGLLDSDEETYGTSPTMADMDNDGIKDGDEIAFWGENWNVNYDNDTIANNLLDPDADNDSYADGLEIHYGSDPANPNSIPLLTDIMVTGDVQVDHTWKRVTFAIPFLDPVVIATPPSHNDPAPAMVRIRNVSPTGFDIRLQEWDYQDDVHAFETVSYIIMERGHHTLSDGTQVEADTFANVTTSFQTLVFSQPFLDRPVVITSIVTDNETDAVTGRVRKINLSRFQYRMQEQELNSQAHAPETVSYIAWEPSSGTIDGLTFDVNTTPKAVKHLFYPIGFTAPFAEGPVFVADMQTAAGGNTANLRWRNKGLAGVEVKVAEEQSKDGETNHAAEVVGYIAIR